MDEAWRNTHKQIRKIAPSARIEIDGTVCTVYCDAGRASALVAAVEDIDRMLLNIADRRLYASSGAFGFGNYGTGAAALDQGWSLASGRHDHFSHESKD